MHFLISSNFKKYFKTYIDFVDHYWIDYFDKKKLNLQLYQIREFLILIKYKKKIKLIILPGGNDLISKSYLSKIRLNNEIKLINFGLKNNIPILGVCRGMQVLNYFYKGRQKKS